MLLASRPAPLTNWLAFDALKDRASTLFAIHLKCSCSQIVLYVGNGVEPLPHKHIVHFSASTESRAACGSGCRARRWGALPLCWGWSHTRARTSRLMPGL